jgi:hypothetical protein
MRLRTMGVCLLVGGIALNAAVGPLFSVSCKGDVNGDRVVNILDAQAMVANVLTGSASGEGSDANHDGCVDIRDLQFVLARLNRAHSDEAPMPTESKAPGAVLTISDRSWARLETGVVEILSAVSDESSVRSRCHSEPVVVLSSRTERYLYTLTPNAPPFPA